MAKKIRIALLFGGKSVEHEVSLQSARKVYESINRDKYEVVLIGIDHLGKWYLNESSHFLLHADDPKQIKLKRGKNGLALVPGETSHKMMRQDFSESIGRIDVVFPVLHGPFGEDGTVQGLLKLADLPFVGAGVMGSAIGMDKDVMKRLLRDAGIPHAAFLCYHLEDKDNISFEEVEAKLGMPCFVKPANTGSSVGIHKIHNRNEFSRALEDAFQYDRKILFEQYIRGRELECSVLGNENPLASLPGEVIAQHEFYDYDAKYLDEHGARFEIPARLEAELVAAVQDLAVRAFKVLCCEGMARVDFFLTAENKLYVNELNTIPGFTAISMYPKLWQISGVPYAELIDRLIQLALERFQQEKKIRNSYQLNSGS
jgi:D-alanine-D-alanine ligase